MPFVKLDCGVLDSSLWAEPSDVVKVFLTMLAMCDAEGLCPATAPGIAGRANLPLTKVRRILTKLEAPDADDRSGVAEGRRIQRVPGGYLITNYLAYRDKDYGAAERARRYRERKRQAVTRDERDVTRNVTQGEAEAEGEGEGEARSTDDDVPAKPSSTDVADNEPRPAASELVAAGLTSGVSDRWKVGPARSSARRGQQRPDEGGPKRGELLVSAAHIADRITSILNAVGRRRLARNRALEEAVGKALDAGYPEDEIIGALWGGLCGPVEWWRSEQGGNCDPMLLLRFRGGVNPTTGQPARQWLPELLATLPEVGPQYVRNAMEALTKHGLDAEVDWLRERRVRGASREPLGAIEIGTRPPDVREAIELFDGHLVAVRACRSDL
jgi:hypothetical protein